jgi:glycosyltransferase involved in cell wall biosynthesis
VTARPDISVVMATYNRLAKLPRAIASVLSQEGASFELIIVDDASTDDTRSYLTRLTDPRIRAIDAPNNLGPSGARNLGIEAARADVVAFLDSDDLYRPGRLAIPLAALAADPTIVCALSSALTYTRDEPREARIPDVTLKGPAFQWALTCDLFPVETTSMTVRREAAMAIGGFCPKLRFAEDREFLIRLSAYGGGHLIPDVLYEKSWSTDGLSNDWGRHGPGLVAYLSQRPEYLDRFQRLGSYLAVKVLVRDLRARCFDAFWRDLRDFRALHLIDPNPIQLWRGHRKVSGYRRAMSNATALAILTGPPQAWR